MATGKRGVHSSVEPTVIFTEDSAIISVPLRTKQLAGIIKESFLPQVKERCQNDREIAKQVMLLASTRFTPEQIMLWAETGLKEDGLL